MTIINAQLGGKKPTGTKSITTNGTHNVADYEYADVQVPTTAPDYYILKTKDANNVLQNGSTVIDLTGVTDIGNCALAYAYRGVFNLTGSVNWSSLTKVNGDFALSNTFRSSRITSLDLSNLQEITGLYAADSLCCDCSYLTSVNLSSLKKISGNYAATYMFQNCTGLTGTINLDSLEEVSGNYTMQYMFSGCSGITSVSATGLVYLTGNLAYMFQNCTGLTSADFRNLENMYNASFASMFSGCSSLTSVNLSALSVIREGSVFNSAFQNCTQLSALSFPSLAALYYGNGSICSSMCKGCTSLTTMTFPKLASIVGRTMFGQAFANSGLTSLSFPNLAYSSNMNTNTFSNMLNGVTGCTVHFPADWQTPMSSWADVTAGFGGTNTTVLFDLPALTVLDLSGIKNMYTTINAFGNCPNVTKIDLSGLKSIKGGDFNGSFTGCTNVTTIDISGLELIEKGSATSSYGFHESFKGLTGITSVTFDSLTTLIGYNLLYNAFQNCTGLTSVSFPAITTATDGASVFNYMLEGCSGVTVHFPSNFAPNISTATFASQMRGTNTTVLKDLPATE